MRDDFCKQSKNGRRKRKKPTKGRLANEERKKERGCV
jgi:hypothetical protein